MQEYKVIGLMSGTSVDGLDIAFCHFTKDEKRWTYKILEAACVEYDPAWKKRLSSAEDASALGLAQLHIDFGRYMAENVQLFIDRHNIQPDFISSHGHTIFHQPENGLTLQTGSGSVMATALGLPVICDFRTTDVALGGQGAPLVPVGDHYLFADFTYCLNIGGIANISFIENEKRVAFDICPANMILNRIAGEKGLAYDDEGRSASSGKVSEELLSKLNVLEYYQQNYPKSLGKEWVKAFIVPLVDKFSLNTEDKLATFCEHVAMQISSTVKGRASGNMLITGGGALNNYLVSRIKALSGIEISVPDQQTILFKEALIFAFLGVLRQRGESNCLSSVTGAGKDSCGGCVYLG